MASEPAGTKKYSAPFRAHGAGSWYSCQAAAYSHHSRAPKANSDAVEELYVGESRERAVTSEFASSNVDPEAANFLHAPRHSAPFQAHEQS